MAKTSYFFLFGGIDNYCVESRNQTQKEIEMNPKSHDGHAYVGTAFAAKKLNMSVGTVQKLVDAGVLTGYLTPGGHRRISYGELINYKKRNNMALDLAHEPAQPPLSEVGFYIWHGDNQDPIAFDRLGGDDCFQPVSNPMELLNAHAKIKHIFIYAEIEWMNWSQLERSVDDKTHFVIYNSAVLSSTAREHLEKVALLLNTQLTPEFLTGYRLGFLRLDARLA